MQIPAILYRPYREVAQRCKKVLKRHKEGASWWELLEAEGMLETAEHPGLLLIDEGRNSTVRDEDHYRCYLPWELAVEHCREPTIDDFFLRGPVAGEIFASGLERPWTLLGLLDWQIMSSWSINNRERELRFLRAILWAWDVLAAEGARYSKGSYLGEYLWMMTTTPAVVLLKHGVPDPGYDKPVLPPGGPRALLATIGDQPAVTLSPELQAIVRDLTAIPALPAPPMQSMPTPSDTSLEGEEGGEPPYMSPQMAAAIDADDAATVQRLIEEGENPKNLHPEDFFTAMYWASRHGYTEVVRALLDHGASVEERFFEGESPLMMASWEGHRATVALLLERGADPAYRSEEGEDAIGWAELRGHSDIAALLREARRTYPRGSAADESEDWPDDATDEA